MDKQAKHLIETLDLDPLYAFELWCRGNGYADVMDGEWCSDRMSAAVDAYRISAATPTYVVFDPHQGWKALGIVEVSKAR